MNFNKPIKYKNILIFVILFFIGYKIVDNYPVYLSVLKKIFTLLTPFIYALIFAYLLNPLMKLMERKFKLKRYPAVGLTYLIILGILIIIVTYGIPSIIDSIISITKEIPSYINTTQDWINSIIKNDKFYKLIQDAGVLQTLTSLSRKAGNIFVYILDGTINSLLSIISNILMFGFGFLISIYMLLDKEKFIKQVKLLIIIIMGKKQGNNILNIGKVYTNMIGNYIGIKAIDSLIIGSISLVGLFILDIPYYILLAALVGFTNMIPYFGPFVSMILCALVAVFISPSKAFAVIIFLLTLQQFDVWYLEPKLVSYRVGLNPLLIILGVTLGGGFLGPIGMILASPTIATLKIYYDKFISNSNPPLNT